MDSTVHEPHIITVISTPAEVAPGESVHLEAIVAGSGPIAWSLCSTPRLPLDNTAVAPGCARGEGPILGTTLAIDAVIPSNACRVFGSETPAGTTPNAPDATGGYYQPVRVTLGDAIAIARIRIQCQLASAPIDAVRDFNARYLRNQPPTLREPRLSDEGRLQIDPSPPESYLRYDAARGSLEDALEQQTVSWFVSAGSIREDGVWVPPNEVDIVQLWVVARDDRGATTALERQLQGLSFLRRPSTTGTILPSIGAY